MQKWIIIRYMADDDPFTIPDGNWIKLSFENNEFKEKMSGKKFQISFDYRGDNHGKILLLGANVDKKEYLSPDDF